MPYDQTYAQDTFANAAADFDYFCDNASSGDQVVNEPTANGNAPDWQWTDEASPSSGTGPPAANGGCTYPESSSPMANGDISRATMITANQVNAALYNLNVTVDVCMFGATAGELKIQAWDGTQWNDLATYPGDSTTTFTSRGPFDCSAYNNSDFSVRIQITNGGTTYQNDFAFQNLRIYGTDAVNYQIAGTTYDKTGSALGSVKCFLCKDNGDNTCTFVDYVLSNASTGAYLFENIADNDAAYFIIAWKDDTPHVFDVTDHVLQPTAA